MKKWKENSFLKPGGRKSRNSEYETHFLLYWLKSNSIKEIQSLNDLNKMNNAFPILCDSDKPYFTHGEEAVTPNAAARCVSEMIKYKKKCYNLVIYCDATCL